MKEIVLKLVEDCERLAIACAALVALFGLLNISICARADMKQNARTEQLMIEQGFTPAQIICATTGNLILQQECLELGIEVE